MAGGLWAVQRVPLIVPQRTSDEILAEWIEENGNAEVTAGYIAPLFYPGIGIQIRDLDLKFVEKGGRRTDFFSAKAIKVVLDSSELLHKRAVVVKEVIVVEPGVTLVMEPSGKFNVARWAKDIPAAKKKEEEPAPARKDESLIAWRVKEVLRQYKPTADTGLQNLLKMERVRIEKARVRLVDNCKSKKFLRAPMNLSNINVDFNGALGDKPAGLDLSMPFPQGYGSRARPLRLHARLKAPSNEKIAITSLTGGWSDIRFHQANATLRLKPSFSFDANLDATASFPNIHEVATWRPVAFSKTMPDMDGRGKGRVRVHVWGPDKKKAAKVHYQGKVDLYDMMYYPGRVTGPIHHLDTTIHLDDGIARMDPTTVVVEDNRITGSGYIKEAKNPRFVLNVSSDLVDFKTFFQPRKTRYKRGDKMLPMRTLWGGHAELGEGRYGKIRLYDAEGTWDVTNKRHVTFSDLYFRACGGSYTESGRSWINFNDPVIYRFRFDGKIRDMDMTAFVDQIFDTTTFLHGSVDADGFVKGRFNDGEFEARSLNGHIKFTVKDGYFEGFNLVGNAMALFGMKVPEDFAGQKFRLLTCHATFKDGVAYTDDLYVESRSLKADVKGWIDFATSHTDMKIKLSFARPVSKFMRDLPAVGAILGPTGDAVTTVYVRASGHWDYLEYSVWNPMEDGPPAGPDVEPPPPDTGLEEATGLENVKPLETPDIEKK